MAKVSLENGKETSIFLSAPLTKKARVDSDCEDLSQGEPLSEDFTTNTDSDDQSECDFDSETEVESGEENDTGTLPGTIVGCSSLCCVSEEKAFQPNDKPTVQLLRAKKRNFQPSWYKQFPWLSVCTNRKKVDCRYAVKQNWFTFGNAGEDVFTKKGFQNWKKAIEKFKAHESSLVHKEAKIKLMAQGRPTIGCQLSLQIKKNQQIRRSGLICQLRGIQNLARQGSAFQGHTELEGNLKQQLLTWSHEIEALKVWIKENRFTCHQTVNEIITIMGQSVLRNLLEKIRQGSPAWFSIIADEATDTCKNEQLNLSIRWVDDNYEAFEDSIGLCKVPINTKAETLFRIIKDLLTRCNLPLGLCRGQAYDGAANMQGKRTGVAQDFIMRIQQPYLYTVLPIH